MRSLSFLFLALLQLSLGPISGASEFEALVVFGDSLSDVNNTFVFTNLSWPLVPPYFEGRFSNGEVWNEYLATLLQAKLFNYAYGGATSNNNLIQGFTGPESTISVPSALEQISLFNDSYIDYDKTLFAYWVGVNDFFFLLANGGTPDLQFINEVVENQILGLETLQEKGAKYFIIPNMFDLSASPSVISSPISSAVKSIIKGHNDILKLKLLEFETNCSGCTVLSPDFFSFGEEFFQGNTSNGITNLSSPCLNTTSFTICEQPQTYLYWDTFHFTTTFHSILANYTFNLLPISPPTPSPTLAPTPSTSTPPVTPSPTLSERGYTVININFAGLIPSN